VIQRYDQAVSAFSILYSFSTYPFTDCHHMQHRASMYHTSTVMMINVSVQYSNE
jgi:hypothetical protein